MSLCLQMTRKKHFMSFALVGVPDSISRIHIQQPPQVVHNCCCKTDVKLEDETKEIFYWCGSSDAMSGCQSWVIPTAVGSETQWEDPVFTFTCQSTTKRWEFSWHKSCNTSRRLMAPPKGSSQDLQQYWQLVYKWQRYIEIQGMGASSVS